MRVAALHVAAAMARIVGDHGAGHGRRTTTTLLVLLRLAVVVAVGGQWKFTLFC
jgi:hypothetical protein